MDNKGQQLLCGIRANVKSLSQFAHDIAECALPDFKWQSLIEEDDFVKPLQLLRFPDEHVFQNEDRFLTFYDLIYHAVCVLRASFRHDDSVLAAYLTSLLLEGVVSDRAPDAVEFGVADTTHLFVTAANLLADMVPSPAAEFLIALYDRAGLDDACFWSSLWVRTALLAGSVSLLGNEGSSSQHERELAKVLKSTQWADLVTRVTTDDASEAAAMSALIGGRKDRGERPGVPGT